MNEKQLKELELDFMNIIKKYSLDDVVLVSNKVIVKPTSYDSNQTMSCLFAGLENVVSDITCKLAKTTLYNDYDEAYDRMSKEFNIIITILKQRIKKRVEEEKSKNLVYN